MGNYNFKMRVKENIGADSEYHFGSVGSEIEVINGSFIDQDGTTWNRGGAGYESIETINKVMGERDEYQTLFELVEDDADVEENIFYIQVVKNGGKRSKELFGGVGTIIPVKNGEFVDLEGDIWNKYGHPFANLEEIHKVVDEVSYSTWSIRFQMATIEDIRDYKNSNAEAIKFEDIVSFSNNLELDFLHEQDFIEVGILQKANLLRLDTLRSVAITEDNLDDFIAWLVKVKQYVEQTREKNTIELTQEEAIRELEKQLGKRVKIKQC